jgi:PAS domain S-box-containing protein
MFRWLFEHSSDPMLLLDGDQFVDCNQAAAVLMGCETRTQLLHTNPADLSPESQPDGRRSRDKANELIEIVRRDGTLRFDWVHQRLDGQLIPVEVLLTAMPMGARSVIHVVWRDITDRILAYQALEDRINARTIEMEQHREVTQGMHDILTILNSNRPLHEMLDYLVVHASRLLRSNAVAIFQLERDRQTLQIQAGLGIARRAIDIPLGLGATGRAASSRLPVVIADTQSDLGGVDPLPPPLEGQFRAVLALPLLIKDDVYGAITAYYPEPHIFTGDETRLAAAFGDYAALAIENARLRARAEQAAVAAERSRLARDLHDSVTQTLFSASLIAEVLPRLWERNPSEGHCRLEELRHLTRGALAEMRTLLLELRPSTLIEVELGELLRQLIEAAGSRSQVPITLQIEGGSQPRLPPDVHIAFYRIAQEALNNVARHADATQARVSLRYRSRPTGHGEAVVRRAEMRISDNGRGFDPAQVTPAHLGLGIMRERAQAVDARLAIISRPGHGTRIVVTWSA